MSLSLEDADRALAARLGPKALGHCRRVAETAHFLAETYDIDPNAAELAGLLHDWDRELKGAALVDRARGLGIDITPAEELVPYLLHARTAAADLKITFPGLPREVLMAVERHTMGAPEMTDLERVVYLADMLEPARDFAGVEELRAAIGAVTLHELFVRGYAQTLRSLADRRRPIHPSTVETWNALLAEGNHD